MQMIPFAPKPLAQRQRVAGMNALLAQGVGQGFSVWSIKGKVWHLTRGDEKTLITKKAYDEHGNLMDTGEPAASIEVVILNANPNLSRVYYATGYEEGSDAKPDCYSNSGIEPEADAVNPQSAKCATCPHSQYGSKISDNGNKGFACANSRRIAVASPSNLEDPILLRVPGASLKALAAYAKELDGHGYLFNEVITKIGFDYSVAHPALTFKPFGLVPPEHLAEVTKQAASDVVAQMIGTQAMTPRAVDPERASEKLIPSAPVEKAPAPVAPQEAKPKAAAKPKAVPKAADALEEVIAKAEAAPTKAVVRVETPAVVTDDIESNLDDMLSSISFDD